MPLLIRQRQWGRARTEKKSETERIHDVKAAATAKFDIEQRHQVIGNVYHLYLLFSTVRVRDTLIRSRTSSDQTMDHQ